MTNLARFGEHLLRTSDGHLATSCPLDFPLEDASFGGFFYDDWTLAALQPTGFTTLYWDYSLFAEPNLHNSILTWAPARATNRTTCMFMADPEENRNHYLTDTVQSVSQAECNLHFIPFGVTTHALIDYLRVVNTPPGAGGYDTTFDHFFRLNSTTNGERARFLTTVLSSTTGHPTCNFPSSFSLAVGDTVPLLITPGDPVDGATITYRVACTSHGDGTDHRDFTFAMMNSGIQR